MQGVNGLLQILGPQKNGGPVQPHGPHAPWARACLTKENTSKPSTSLENVPLILADMLKSINQRIIYFLWTVVSSWLVMKIDYVQCEILWLYRPLMVWLSRGTAVDKYLKRSALPQSRPHN